MIVKILFDEAPSNCLATDRWRSNATGKMSGNRKPLMKSFKHSLVSRCIENLKIVSLAANGLSLVLAVAPNYIHEILSFHFSMLVLEIEHRENTPLITSRSSILWINMRLRWRIISLSFLLSKKCEVVVIRIPSSKFDYLNLNEKIIQWLLKFIQWTELRYRINGVSISLSARNFASDGFEQLFWQVFCRLINHQLLDISS